MAKTPKTRNYVFKPMKTLTFWTLLLIGARLGGLAVYWLCFVAMIVTGQIINLDSSGDALIHTDMGIFRVLAGVAYFFTYVVSGIITLFWLYGAARNAKAIRPAMEFTPGWAVGWYFVPLANLIKPYEVLRDIWIAGKDRSDGLTPKPAQRLLVWWLCNIGGGLLTGVASRMDADAGMASAILSSVGLPLLFISTAVYFGLVREIHRDQLRSDTRIVDQF